MRTFLSAGVWSALMAAAFLAIGAGGAFAGSATCDIAGFGPPADPANLAAVSAICPDGSFAQGATTKANQAAAAAAAVDKRVDSVLAVAAALQSPYLEPDENFSVSGGVGFSEGEAAFGGTGMLRIAPHAGAFAGGAVSADGKNWAGKFGGRLAF